MTGLVDADVHIDVPPVQSLFPYLSDHWVEHFTKTADRGASPPLPVAPAPGQPRISHAAHGGPRYYPDAVGVARAPRLRSDTPFPVADQVGALGLAELQRWVFGSNNGASGLDAVDAAADAAVAASGAAAAVDTTAESGRPRAAAHPEAGRLRSADVADAAIASCLYAVDSIYNPDTAVALARAVNDWQIREWLEPEPRLYGSIVIPIQLPALAIAEVERVAEHPALVQVLVPARTPHPLGSRLYHPLWETIARHDLVVGVHFGGAPGVPPTPTGNPSTFFEVYAAMAQVFATQLTSLVVEGVFDAAPELRVAFLESGFTWLPAHMWRMDKEWRNLRRLVPWVKRPPSAYVREHVRLGIQPLDPPPHPDQMRDIVDQLGSEELLMYSSDFPHAHAFDAEPALLDLLPAATRQKVRGDNARDFYRLPKHRGPARQ